MHSLNFPSDLENHDEWRRSLAKADRLSRFFIQAGTRWVQSCFKLLLRSFWLLFLLFLIMILSNREMTCNIKCWWWSSFDVTLYFIIWNRRNRQDTKSKRKEWIQNEGLVQQLRKQLSDAQDALVDERSRSTSQALYLYCSTHRTFWPVFWFYWLAAFFIWNCSYFILQIYLQL